MNAFVARPQLRLNREKNMTHHLSLIIITNKKAVHPTHKVAESMRGHLGKGGALPTGTDGSFQLNRPFFSGVDEFLLMADSFSIVSTDIPAPCITISVGLL